MCVIFYSRLYIYELYIIYIYIYIYIVKGEQCKKIFQTNIFKNENYILKYVFKTKYMKKIKSI